MISLVTIIAAINIAFAALPPQFSGANVVYFGDSLTDMGNNTIVDGSLCTSGAAPVTNRTSGTNAGETWADIATPPANFHAVPSGVLNYTGGNDYAYSGATIRTMNLYTSPTAHHPSHSIYANELSFFEAHHQPINGNTLAVIWGGANDILYSFDNFKFTGVPANVPQYFDQIATYDYNQYLLMVIRLHTMGINNFLFIGMPDLGATPAASVANPTPAQQANEVGALYAERAQLSQISATWNATLPAYLIQRVLGNPMLRSTHVYFYNPMPLMDSIVANPSAFGFTYGNQKTWCANSADSANKYMFFNFIHPTSALQTIIAQQIRAGAEPL